MKYNTCDSAKGYAYRGCNSCLVGLLFFLIFIIISSNSLSVLLSHNCLLLLAVLYYLSRLHREKLRALKRTTSKSVIARVTVKILATVYQIVLSIMSRVILMKLAFLWKILPFMTDRVKVIMLVERCKIPSSEMDRAMAQRI